MHATYSRTLVLNAARKARVYWQAEFEKRKEAWIERVAAQAWKPNIFARSRPIGRTLAEERFEHGYDFSGPNLPRCFGGADWKEHRALGVAEYLVNRTDRLGAKCVVLDDEDIAALRPVMKEAKR